mmetsp:Transcript_12527/g.20642  ORF Transcript_12527/g.20642 Transcript_12527/m.20642 type:complete len:491 (-) Transcript_12527:7-1479(-)
MALVAEPIFTGSAGSIGRLPTSVQIPPMPTNSAYIPSPPVSSPIVAAPPQTMPNGFPPPPPTSTSMRQSVPQPPQGNGFYFPSSGVQLAGDGIPPPPPGSTSMWQLVQPPNGGYFPSSGAQVAGGWNNSMLGTQAMRVPPSASKSQSESQWRAEREELIRLVEYQEQMIAQFRETAKRMPERNVPINHQLVNRLDHLEAKILASKLVPVASAEELVPPAKLPDPNRVPNGLLQEFWHRDLVDDNGGDGDDDDGEEDDDERKEQRELERLSMLLGLPTIAQLGLPEDSKIVDIRQVEAPDVPEYRRMPMMPLVLEHQRQPPPMPPPPILRGRIYDSNYAYVPSPYHPVGPLSKMVVDGKPLLQNLYPIDRAPIKYQDVFANPVRGAPMFTPCEKAYKAYADFYEARQCPQRFSETSWDRDVDRDTDVRNVKWRVTPHIEPTAARAVDVSGDGYADVIVVGVDKNATGVPDVLQVPPIQKQVTKACAAIFPY